MFVRFLNWFYQSPEGKLYSDDTEAMSDDNTTEQETETEESTEETTDDTESDKDKDEDADKEEETEEEKDDLEIKDEDKEIDSEEEDDEIEEKESEELSVRVKDVKAKYPDFFKEFPDVKNAIFRAQAFTEVFPSPKEAQEAQQRSESLAEIERDLLGDGDPDKLLGIIHKHDKSKLESITFRTLAFLQDQDKEAYLEVAAIPIKQLLRGAFNRGGRDEQGNLTNLGKAALVLHNWYFNNDELNEKVKGEGAQQKVESKEEKEYRSKIDALNAKQLNEFNNSVDNSYVKRMDNHIREGLDKDDRLTPMMKNLLVKEILGEIKSQLSKDPRYMGTLKSLYNQAAKSEYANDFKSRIVSTALARAKSLVPEMRKKYVAEMLNTKTKTNTNTNTNTKDAKEESKGEKKKPITFSASKRSQSGKPDKSKSDLDILREA